LLLPNELRETLQFVVERARPVFGGNRSLLKTHLLEQ
jgi:hypothetical protein